MQTVASKQNSFQTSQRECFDAVAWKQFEQFTKINLSWEIFLHNPNKFIAAKPIMVCWIVDSADQGDFRMQVREDCTKAS